MHQRDHLADVEARATTKGDHAIMHAHLVGLHTGDDIGLNRIGPHVREQLHRQAGGFQVAENIRHHRRGREAGSVTNSGRLMPVALHSSASSLTRPAPNLIAVG